MTPAEMMQCLRDNYDEEILTADGFDDALIGVADLWHRDKDGGASQDTVACYDYLKCIEILMKRDGMEEEDAHEYMSFNVLRAYVGQYTPVFVHDWRKEQEEVLEADIELEEVEGLREQLRRDERREAVGEDRRGQE